MGHGLPLQVKEGQRVLMHVLNSSPTEEHWIALAGHTFKVVALDGNDVPTPRQVAMLRLGPAERVCAVVEMNRPGVWVLGEVRKHIQAAGMAMVVEYAGQSGEAKWEQPESLDWSYLGFGGVRPSKVRTLRVMLRRLRCRWCLIRSFAGMAAWSGGLSMGGLIRM